jgi:hypothetical protein
MRSLVTRTSILIAVLAFFLAIYPPGLAMLRKATPRAARIPSSWLSLSRRSYASVTDVSTFPSAGSKLHGFTLQRTQHVPELELTAVHLTHDKTGAEYLHVARNDANNVFSIGFKTNPPDATGVPHILEHTTLCGSEKYVPP